MSQHSEAATHCPLFHPSNSIRNANNHLPIHPTPASLVSRSSQLTNRSKSSSDSASRARQRHSKRPSLNHSISASRRAPSKSKGKSAIYTNNVLLGASPSRTNAPLLNGNVNLPNGCASPSSPPTRTDDALDDARPTSSHSHINRSASTAKLHKPPHHPNGVLLGGTIQRSKVGGRVAASSSSYMGGTFAGNLYGPHHQPRKNTNSNLKSADQPVPKKNKSKEDAERERDVSVLPTPASVSIHHRLSLKQQQAPASGLITTSTNGNGHIPSTRRSSSSQRSKKSNGSSKSVNARALLGAGGVSKRAFDIDTEYSGDSDTDWTDDGSEEGSGNEHDDREAVQEEKESARMLAFAAQEAARERSMFTKLDKRSYTDLSRSRTQPSLLSMIFHPDPQLFPPDHPYRHTRSTQDILAHAVGPRNTSIAPSPAGSVHVSGQHHYHQPTKLQAVNGKAAMAGPVKATVVASSVSTSNMQNGTNERQRSPLRLRGRPDDVDVEDSESEGEDNKIHMSESVAQKKLAQLHMQQNVRRAAGNGNGKSQLSQHLSHIPPQPSRAHTALAGVSNAAAATTTPSPLARVATEPITVAYPYNLPAPLPPSTPRTTRRTMLTHELSESLRRNLLWERQVSRLRPVGNGVGRRAGAGGASANASNASNLNPNANPNGSANLNGNGRAASTGTGTGEKVAEEEKKRRLERNRSWADTYHTSGW